MVEGGRGYDSVSVSVVSILFFSAVFLGLVYSFSLSQRVNFFFSIFLRIIWVGSALSFRLCPIYPSV